jgi:hypothetical protein
MPVEQCEVKHRTRNEHECRLHGRSRGRKPLTLLALGGLLLRPG